MRVEIVGEGAMKMLGALLSTVGREIAQLERKEGRLGEAQTGLEGLSRLVVRCGER